MKAMIDGIEVEVKTVENLGYQAGYHTKAVVFEGKERIVIKMNGKWQSRPPHMKF